MEVDIKIAPDNNKMKVGGIKTTSLDICQPKHHHAPLERQMCLQLPEERPFLRRCKTFEYYSYILGHERFYLILTFFSEQINFLKTN